MANANPIPVSSNLQLARRTDTGIATQVSMSEWQVIREQAATLVTTGFLPQAIKTPEQALAIILTGRELGIGPMAALGSINVIQGKPTVSPQLMLALINRTGEVEKYSLQSSDTGATCTIKRRGQDAYTATFGPKEAAAMGLSNKDNYKKQPATMFKWRAIADACRSTFADALLGLYTPDEMGASTDVETGEVIHAPEPVAPQAVAPVDWERPVEQLASELVAHVTRENGGYEVADTSAGEVFTISKGETGVKCSCGSQGLPPCAHRLAVAMWVKAQKEAPAPEPPSQDEPDVIDAEPVDAPQFESESHQAAFDAQMPTKVEADPALINKSQLIVLCGLTKQLEGAGVEELAWRDQLEKITGSRSRKGVMQDELAKVIFAFNKALEAAQRKQSGKAKAK